MANKSPALLHPYQRANRLDAAEATAKKREAQRAHVRGSWWTRGAAPDQRDVFMMLAHKRHAELDARQHASTSMGIGLWNRLRGRAS